MPQPTDTGPWNRILAHHPEPESPIHRNDQTWLCDAADIQAFNAAHGPASKLWFCREVVRGSYRTAERRWKAVVEGLTRYGIPHQIEVDPEAEIERSAHVLLTITEDRNRFDEYVLAHQKEAAA